MNIAIKIGVGLYLVGVMTLGGLVVHYLSRVPLANRLPQAAWWSGIVAALVWPFLVAWVIGKYALMRIRARRAAKTDVAARAASRQLKRARARQTRKAMLRLATPRFKGAR